MFAIKEYSKYKNTEDKRQESPNRNQEASVILGFLNRDNRIGYSNAAENGAKEQ